YRANALLDAHVDDPEYGYRLLVGEAAEAGEVMCEWTAWKICRDNQWWSVFGKKRGKNGVRPGPPVHDDLVQRDFSADDVNELWLTDVPPQAGGAPTWIERAYHRRRRQARLGRLAPSNTRPS